MIVCNLCSSLLVCLILLLFGCEIISFGDSSQERHPDDEVLKLVWDTSGGGDQRFEITRGRVHFRVRVTRYEFHDADTVIMLSPRDGAVYVLVTDIFEGRRNLYDDTYTPIGLTGTWTTITLTFSGGEQVEIENINAGGDLGIIYDFVRQHMR